MTDGKSSKEGHSLGNAPGTQQENLGICVILSNPKAKYLHLDYSKTFCLPNQLLFLCGMVSLPDLKNEQGTPPATRQGI